MKKKYLITFYRVFKSNYYLIRTVSANKSVKQGYKECRKFAFHNHLLKGKCLFFKVTAKN